MKKSRKSDFVNMQHSGCMFGGTVLEMIKLGFYVERRSLGLEKIFRALAGDTPPLGVAVAERDQ